MNSERFIELTRAYGAAPQRWPTAERDAALALLDRLDATGTAAREALAEARAIDDALSSYQVSAPDQQLIDQVLASFHHAPASHQAAPHQAAPHQAAPRQAAEGKQRPRHRWQWARGAWSGGERRWSRPRLWFSGIGLLGAGAAGIATGVMVMSLLYSAPSASSISSSLSSPLSEPPYAGSVFSNSASDWSDE